MSMQFEIEEEYNQFLEDIKDPDFVLGRYMDKHKYERIFPYNSIYEATELLQNKIRKYLQKNRPNEFVIISDWCINVLRCDRAKQLFIKRRIDLRLVR